MISAIVTSVLVLSAWQVSPGDTLQLGADEAFRMALEAAPTLEASRLRARAADALVRQAGAWPNPTLSIAAENLGASRTISGVPGVEGVEGQALISGLLHLGGDRGAARSLAQARLMEASFQAEGAEAGLRVAVIEALARVTRDDERLRRAREEASGLEALADALATQAERGRASEGEAARAHLAMVSAHTIAAEVAAAAATSREDLALLLGLEPGTPLRLTLSVCEARPPGESLDTRPAEVLVASARQQIAAAGVVQRRATRIPDLLPQIGVRRAAGVSALYVGFSLPLPLFDRSGASVDAAIAEEDAQAAELERVERSVAAQREAARQGVLALEAAGTRYTPTWAAALDRSVVATESRYRLGEGTLTELLDGRRARLQALDDYERWRAELFSGRARFALLAGGSIDPSLLCGASLPSMTHTPENRP